MIMNDLTDPNVPYRVVVRISHEGAAPEQTLVEDLHIIHTLLDPTKKYEKNKTGSFLTQF